MPIIDFHTHIFPDALAPRAMKALLAGCDGRYQPVTDLTEKGLLARMDEWKIDKSVVQPVVTKPSQVNAINDWAAEISSDRILSFGGIFPSSPDVYADVDGVVSRGLRGIKLHPEYQGFDIDSPEMLRLYDYILSKGLILLFHTGFDPAFPPPFHSDPRRVAKVADEMKGGKIVAAHLGSMKMWDEVEKELAGHDLYLDTSMGFGYYSRETFLGIAEKHPTSKILFATDSPWSNAHDELTALFSLPLPREEIEAIAGGNAEKLLGL